MSLYVLEAIHWITLCLYLIVTIKAILLLPYVKQCPHKQDMDWIVYAYLVCLLCLTSVFIWLQVDWIVENYDQVVETEHAYLWAIYNVTNAFVQFFYLLGLEVWIKWRVLDKDGNVCIRRRKDDP